MLKTKIKKQFLVLHSRSSMKRSFASVVIILQIKDAGSGSLARDTERFNTRVEKLT